jgi:NAD(P)-dependent dehydrogenase (short-subunit alcohol dehydrogenase family)
VVSCLADGQCLSLFLHGPFFFMTEDGGLTARGQEVMDHTPQKRFGQAQDLLGAVCWLMDNERAAFVTGITVPVDGGFLATSGV